MVRSRRYQGRYVPDGGYGTGEEVSREKGVFSCSQRGELILVYAGDIKDRRRRGRLSSQGRSY